MTTARIHDFLATRRPASPCLVVDLDVVRDNYCAFTKALPDSRIFYAVKANPAPEILKLLASLNSSFDTASVAEIEMALDAGATAERISFGNTIKKERDIARAPRTRHPSFRRRLRRGSREDRPFRTGCAGFLPRPHRRRRRRVAAVAQIRLRTENGRRCPRTRRAPRPHRLWRLFPCRLADDPPRRMGQGAGRRSLGVRAHVGKGHHPEDGQYGRRFPDPLPQGTCPRRRPTARRSSDALRKHFGNRIPETIIEPGRGMVGNAGVIKSEVVLVSKKSDNDNVRWVYLDIGKFGGLAETMDEAIRYNIVTPRDGDAAEPCVLAGPTCDFRRRALRKDALSAAAVPDHRRRGSDRRHWSLHDDLFGRRVQRLRAVALLRHLTARAFGNTTMNSLVHDGDAVTIALESAADVATRDAVLARAMSPN
jgi:ornithine decarboxylase